MPAPDDLPWLIRPMAKLSPPSSQRLRQAARNLRINAPKPRSEFLALLGHMRRLSLNLLTGISLTLVAGMLAVAAVPFFITGRFSLADGKLLESYPSLPIVMFIITVAWLLALMLVAGIGLVSIARKVGTSCPRCDRLVTLLEHHRVSTSGLCPGCRMPIFGRDPSASRHLQSHRKASEPVKPEDTITLPGTDMAPASVAAPGVAPEGQSEEPIQNETVMLPAQRERTDDVLDVPPSESVVGASTDAFVALPERLVATSLERESPASEASVPAPAPVAPGEAAKQAQEQAKAEATPVLDATPENPDINVMVASSSVECSPSVREANADSDEPRPGDSPSKVPARPAVRKVKLAGKHRRR